MLFKKFIVTIGFIGFALFIFIGLSQKPRASIQAQGFLNGQYLNTTVDTQIAALMLSKPNDAKVLALFEAYEDRPLDTQTLSHIAKTYSLDSASFYFLLRSYLNAQNKQAQDLFVANFNDQTLTQNAPSLDILKDYLVVFVPGLAYRQDTTTGADLARQRLLLSQYAIANVFIEVDEWGLVDDNAALIAKKLKSLSQSHAKIIVVSASKGGLETAIALGKIMSPDDTKSIKAWVNVGGILRGSPIADDYLTAPKSWFATLMLMSKGKKMNLVHDLSYKKRKASFNQLQIPESIKIIDYVGVPLATKISKKIKSRFDSMTHLGPNDGLTPLADEVSQNGILVSDIGLDHYFNDPNIDKKTLALALVAAKIQD